MGPNGAVSRPRMPGTRRNRTPYPAPGDGWHGVSPGQRGAAALARWQPSGLFCER